MRIILIGGEGTIGRKVRRRPAETSEVVNAHVRGIEGKTTGQVVTVYGNR